MRFSDLFRDMHLGTLGVLALVLFFTVFVAIAVRTLFLRRRETDSRLERLPLDDDLQENRP